MRSATPILGLGDPGGSAYGDRGITKRLTMLAAIHRPPGGDLLDIGCGPGSYTIRMAAHYDRTVGLDVDPPRLAALGASAPAGTRLAAMVGNAEAMPFPDESFDAVTAIEVLEHVPDLPACMAEVHRVLKPRGLMMITTPNRWFPFETHGAIIRGRRRAPAHVPFATWLRPVHRRISDSDARVFTWAELADLAAQAGFAVVGSTYMMPPFDRSGVGRRVRALTDALERSPLRVFGMTHIVVLRRT